jgi:predicted membrane protein
MPLRTLSLLLCLFIAAFVQAAPQNFDQAKTELRRYVYHDQNTLCANLIPYNSRLG